jgi:hypothetical protein
VFASRTNRLTITSFPTAATILWSDSRGRRTSEPLMSRLSRKRKVYTRISQRSPATNNLSANWPKTPTSKSRAAKSRPKAKSSSVRAKSSAKCHFSGA